MYACGKQDDKSEEHGLDQGPKHGNGTWDEFIKIHASTLWACDFFSKPMWTWKGPIDLYLLVFLHVGSRKVWISSATAHPDSAWVAQQARNFCMELGTEPEAARYVLHDGDSKFTAPFREILRSEGIQPKRISPVSPNLNAYVERFGQTLKHECLDHFIVVGQRHMDRIVAEFVRYYHDLRPHQSLDNRPPFARQPVTESPVDPAAVVCHKFLGGLLKHYERRAA